MKVKAIIYTEGRDYLKRKEKAKSMGLEFNEKPDEDIIKFNFRRQLLNTFYVDEETGNIIAHIGVDTYSFVNEPDTLKALSIELNGN